MQDNELHQAAIELLEKAHAYFKHMHKRGLSGGCIWLTDKEGAMVIFTRGEYRNQLMKNIETTFDEGRAYSFGTASK